MKIGILGAGGIAVQMAKTVAGMKDVENYAYRPHFILDGVGCIPPQA